MEVKAFDEKVEKFIDSLERQTRSKVERHIDLLEKFGNQLRMPYSKSLGSNLFELRIKGQHEVRVFYTFDNNKAVFLHGFIKKSQKTPQKELEIAKSKLKLLTNT